jgi:hypothetical protein
LVNQAAEPSGNRGKVEAQVTKEKLKCSADASKIGCVEYHYTVTMKIYGEKGTSCTPRANGASKQFNLFYITHFLEHYFSPIFTILHSVFNHW